MNTQVDEGKNAIDVAAIGHDAAKLWRSSERDGAKGDGLAIFALFQAFHTMTFSCEVKDRKGNVEETIHFDLEEYMDKDRQPTSENGTRNVKAIAARTNTLLGDVFGIEEPTAADKQRLIRALTCVGYLVRLGFAPDEVKLSKRRFLVVPYQAMHAAPDPDKATANDIKQYEKMIGEDWEIDGKKGNSLAELLRLANPPKARASQAADGNADKGASFKASVKLISATLPAFIDEDGDNKSDVPAPNEELRKELWELKVRLDAYFEADPMEEQDQQRKSA